MTKAEKIEWAANCTNEELVEQMYWTVVRMQSNNLTDKIDANEDHGIVKAELLKRLG